MGRSPAGGLALGLYARVRARPLHRAEDGRMLARCYCPIKSYENETVRHSRLR